MVLLNFTRIIGTPEPPTLTVATVSTARTRLRVVRRLNRLTRYLIPRRFVSNLLLELMERQFVQPPVHVRPVLDGVSNPAQVLEDDNWVRELLGELHHNPRQPVKNPLSIAFFFLPELVVDGVFPMFLTAFGDGVVALAFGFHRAVVKHECSERVHRLTVKSGESDVALVNIDADECVSVFWFRHFNLCFDRDV